MAEAGANAEVIDAVAFQTGIDHLYSLSLSWLRPDGLTVRLTRIPRRVYEAFLNSDSVKAVLNQTRSALAAITVLKKASHSATLIPGRPPLRLFPRALLCLCTCWCPGMRASAAPLCSAQQVCDHPALLSSQAANLVMRGGNRLAGRANGLSSDEEEDDFVSCSSSEAGDADDDYRKAGPGKQASRREGCRQGREWAGPGSATLGEEDCDGGDWWTWAGEDIQVPPPLSSASAPAVTL